MVVTVSEQVELLWVTLTIQNFILVLGLSNLVNHSGRIVEYNSQYVIKNTSLIRATLGLI